MTMNSAPVTWPTMRDVSPAAADRPIEPDVVPTAGAPRRPDSIVATPLAASPPRIEFISGRSHFASLMRCAVVKSPMARNDDAIAAMANGSIRLLAMVGQPKSETGKCTRWSARCSMSCQCTSPSSSAAT